MNTPAWRRYLRFWQSDVEDDVDEELRFHVDMREQEYVASGRAPDEAHAAALDRFGNVAAVRDSCYEIDHRHSRHLRLREWLRGIWNDVVFGLRQLTRNAGFAVAAILTLALGIGTNGLVFGLVNSILLRPLPGVSAPERLLLMSEYAVSYPSYRDFRDANPALSGLAAFGYHGTAVSVGSATTWALVAVTSANYFKVLGVPPSRGRTLLPSDDDVGAAPVAVLSEAFVRSHYAEGVDPVGTTIDLNGSPVTVVGVAAHGFRGTELDRPEALWIPVRTWPVIAPAWFSSTGLEDRGHSWLSMIGRLKPNETIDAAAAAQRVSAARQSAAYPQDAKFLAQSIRTNPPVPASIAAMSSVSHGTTVRSATILLAAVTIVLLIACANVSNLLLARAMSRRREFGIRLAMGAGRGRIIRQLLTETCILALIATAVALFGMLLATRAMTQVEVKPGISLAMLGAGVNWRVTAYTIAIALVASITFAIAPTLQGTREADTIDVLKDGTPGAGRSRSRLRRGLLVAQVALSLTLLIGAGLFARSLRQALATDPGFDGSHVATADVNVGLIPSDSARIGEVYEAILRKLNSTPGVQFAAFGTTLPLSRGSDTYGFRLDNYIPPEGPHSGIAVDDVTPQFMQVFSIPLLRGRLFNEHDGPLAPHVAIINQTMASRFWHNADPIGQRIMFNADGGSVDTVLIVGVVRDTKYHDLRETPQPYVYRLLGQRIASSGLWEQQLAVRGNGDPAALLDVIRRSIHTVAPEVPVYDAATFEQRTTYATLAQRSGTLVLGLFGILALIMTAVGIYGVVSYSVAQRTREIGIRMALGARTQTVLRLIVVDNAGTLLLGIALGLTVSLALTRSVSSFLFGVSPMDATTFISASLVLLAVGAVASVIPALRATRVDPIIALRGD
jgi:predicted permease